MCHPFSYVGWPARVSVKDMGLVTPPCAEAYRIFASRKPAVLEAHSCQEHLFEPGSWLLELFSLSLESFFLWVDILLVSTSLFHCLTRWGQVELQLEEYVLHRVARTA